MELWVRSQFRDALIKLNNIYTYKTGNEIELRTDFSVSKEYILGRYATKERALEVLDEIQRLITDLQYMSYAVDSSSFYSYRPNVYEMPQE